MALRALIDDGFPILFFFFLPPVTSWLLPKMGFPQTKVRKRSSPNEQSDKTRQSNRSPKNKHRLANAVETCKSMQRYRPAAVGRSESWFVDSSQLFVTCLDSNQSIGLMRVLGEIARHHVMLGYPRARVAKLGAKGTCG